MILPFFQLQQKNVDQAYPKIPSERLRIEFCKHLLGVTKRETHFANLS